MDNYHISITYKENANPPYKLMTYYVNGKSKSLDKLKPEELVIIKNMLKETLLQLEQIK